MLYEVITFAFTANSSFVGIDDTLAKGQPDSAALICVFCWLGIVLKKTVEYFVDVIFRNPRAVVDHLYNHFFWFIN